MGGDVDVAEVEDVNEDEDGDGCGSGGVKGRGCKEDRISSWNCRHRRTEGTLIVLNRW